MLTIFPYRLSFIAGSCDTIQRKRGKRAQRGPIFLIHTDNPTVAREGTEEVPFEGILVYEPCDWR